MSIHHIAKKLIRRASRLAIEIFENFFYWWGCTVASNPFIVIVPCLIFTGLCSLGFLNFSSEADGWKLFLPEGSRHLVVQNWREEHFVEDSRGTITLFNHEENVLTREGLLLLLDLHEKVRDVHYEGKNYTHACMKIPITNIGLSDKRRRRRRRKRESSSLNAGASSSEEQASEDYDYEYPEYFNFYGNDEQSGDDEYVNFYGPGQHQEASATAQKEEKLDGLPREVYCDIVETLEDKCGEFSLLEIWKYDRDVISKLSQQDIIDAVNTVDESPVLGYETDYTSYLGEKQYSETGWVIGAKSVRSIWLLQFSPEDIPPTQKLTGFEIDQVDPFTFGYEEEVLKVMKKWREDRAEEGKGYSFNMNLGLSFNTEASGPIEYDINRQICGYVVMFLYTMFTLGQLNIVEHKFYLAGAGILSIFFGYIIGVGLTMAFGFPYTPVTGLLPFICLGIGIDDMFVIMRCFKNIPEKEKERNGLVKNVGLTMQHAGVSITVTSLTDICAFAVGAITFFPALQSFCISAAFAIGAIYLFQSSWFVACMVLDQRRIQAKRDGFLPFLVHTDWEPPKWTQKDIGYIVMSKVGKMFDYRIIQALIVLATAAMFGIGIWGTYEMKVEYNPITLIPDGSYFKEWLDQRDVDFPSDGWGVIVYTQGISYTMEDFEKIDMIATGLDNLTREHNEWVHYGKQLSKAVQVPFERGTGFWWLDLKEFIAEHKTTKDWREVIRLGKLPLYLSDFLNHEDGSIYKNNFRFDGNITCNMEAPTITATKLGTLKFRDLKGPKEHLPAQHGINNIIEKADLSNTTFAYSDIYPAWEIDEILSGELYRNLALALLCVVVIVSVMLADITLCLIILGCVLFTMVDVVGLAHFLGMTVDPFMLVAIIIGIGLSVDYGSHIAHSFVISKGKRKERAINGFVAIGPAILHGGITTFLAIVFLAFSESHVFVTFFKMISLTVVFGLYHGLLFLPVMLILVGTNNVEVSDDPNDGNHSDCSTVDSEKYLKSNIQSYGSNHIGEVSIKEKPEKHFDKPGLSVISCNELDQS